MKRMLKWLCAASGLVVLALVAGVLAVTLLLDPNQFKPLLQSQFKAYTGLDTQIPGNIAWTFWPHVGMEVDEVVIQQANQENSTLKHLVLRVKLGPLLHKELQLSKVTIDQVQWNQLELNKLGAKLRLKDQVLEIQPLTANIYQGVLHSEAKISLQSTPRVIIAGNLDKVALAPLIQGLTAKKSRLVLDGQADLAANIEMQGRTRDEMLQQLKGSGRLQLNNGVLKGIDIAYYVDTAVALINKEDLPGRTPGDQTPFGQVTGTANIENGVLYNNDLVLDATDYVVHGKGSLDMVHHGLNFQLEVSIKPGRINAKLKALENKVVPITLSGTLEEPVVKLDTLALVQEIGKEQLQRVSERLQKALPDKANKFLEGLFH